MDPARQIPTIEDLEALPPGIKGEIGVYGDDREARIAPFAEVPLDAASWWA